MWTESLTHACENAAADGKNLGQKYVSRNWFFVPICQSAFYRIFNTTRVEPPPSRVFFESYFSCQNLILDMLGAFHKDEIKGIFTRIK